MNATIETLKTAYADALIIQYRTKQKARATIKALTAELWLDGLALTESRCFDLDTATGAQLDILGRIVGVPRSVFGLDLAHVFFETTDYNDTVTGVDFQVYGDTTSGPEIMLRYRSDATYTMTDFEMRTLIRLKIAFNTVPRTTSALIDAFFAIFSWYVVFIDNMNMSVDLIVFEPYHNVFTIAEHLNIIPLPMAVIKTVNYE